MTKAFAQQRAKEQAEYIQKIESSDLPPERKEEILKSARGVMKYFEKRANPAPRRLLTPKEQLIFRMQQLVKSGEIRVFRSSSCIIVNNLSGF